MLRRTSQPPNFLQPERAFLKNHKTGPRQAVRIQLEYFGKQRNLSLAQERLCLKALDSGRHALQNA